MSHTATHVSLVTRGRRDYTAPANRIDPLAYSRPAYPLYVCPLPKCPFRVHWETTFVMFNRFCLLSKPPPHPNHLLFYEQSANSTWISYENFSAKDIGWSTGKLVKKGNYQTKNFCQLIFSQNALLPNNYKPNKNKWVKNYTVL